MMLGWSNRLNISNSLISPSFSRQFKLFLLIFLTARIYLLFLSFALYTDPKDPFNLIKFILVYESIVSIFISSMNFSQTQKADGYAQLFLFSFYHKYQSYSMEKRRLNLKDKMEEINDKFSLKTKSTIANDVLQNKLINIKKKLNAFSTKNEQEMATLKAQAIQLLGRLEQNNIAYQNEAQIQLRQLQQLSLQLHTKIEGEIVQRKQKENQLVQTMERKLKLLRGEIEKEKKERTEIMEQITNTLKNDVPSLMNEVIDSGKARQDEEEKLAEIIEGQIAECQEQTAQFREKQEENCSKVYGLIRELTLKAKKEVEEEKAIREQTHDEILSYVEETCNKLGE